MKLLNLDSLLGGYNSGLGDVLKKAFTKQGFSDREYNLLSKAINEVIQRELYIPDDMIVQFHLALADYYKTSREYLEEEKLRRMTVSKDLTAN